MLANTHDHSSTPRHGRARSHTAIAAAATVAACIAAGVTITAAPLHAQDSLNATSAVLVRNRYLADLDTVHAKFMALANAIPADKYSWRPSAGVRSVSEVLMHVASEWYLYVPRSVAGNPPADFGPPRVTVPKLEKDFTTKDAVLAQLNKAWTHCRQQLTDANPGSLTGRYKPWNVTLPEAAFAMAGDQHEHLGQLIAYARSIGVVPPWSKN